MIRRVDDQPGIELTAHYHEKNRESSWRKLISDLVVMAFCAAGGTFMVWVFYTIVTGVY